MGNNNFVMNTHLLHTLNFSAYTTMTIEKEFKFSEIFFCMVRLRFQGLEKDL